MRLLPRVVRWVRLLPWVVRWVRLLPPVGCKLVGAALFGWHWGGAEGALADTICVERQGRLPCTHPARGPTAGCRMRPRGAPLAPVGR